MNTKDELKTALASLIQDGEEIRKRIPAEGTDRLDFGILYQTWYTKALKVVGTLAQDRLEEFVSYYRIDPKREELHDSNYVIQDYLMGRRGSSYHPISQDNVAFIKLSNQIHIIVSLQSRIDSVFSNVEGFVLADLQDRELATCESLLRVNIRASGALAGVILEQHLQRVCANHSITLTKKNPTISDANEALKSNGVYDLPTYRKIQFLADVRNLCSHKKETEPRDDQVRDLVSGVNDIIKNIS